MLRVIDEGDRLFIAELCIQPACRGYGLGTETARLVREAAEAGPWRVLRAWAPPDLGLAVYFWCRMGLRPLHGEGPDGGIWFERTVG
jgi:GNAT superfamily N-acetyltransferase